MNSLGYVALCPLFAKLRQKTCNREHATARVDIWFDPDDVIDILSWNRQYKPWIGRSALPPTDT